MSRRIVEVRLYLAIVAVLVVTSCDGRSDRDRFVAACGPGPWMVDSPEPESYAIPFHDRGRLATVWRWGKAVPWHEATLVVSDAVGSRALEVDRPERVQWLGPDRLFYVRSWRDDSGPRGGPFVADLDGRVIRDFAAAERLESPVVSPDGRWIANSRWDEQGKGTFEVLPFDGPLEAIATRDDLDGAVWSPDSARLVASRIVQPRGVPRGIHGRELVLTRDLSSEEPLRENRESDGFGFNEVAARWWAPDGIYGIGNGRLQRCDPDGAGCVEVYRPKVEGSLRGVTPGPAGIAYLLVNEEDPCFLETGAREIHRLELGTGRTERLLRTPDGVLLTGIDWVDVPDAEPPVEFPAASRKER